MYFFHLLCISVSPTKDLSDLFLLIFFYVLNQVNCHHISMWKLLCVGIEETFERSLLFVLFLALDKFSGRLFIGSLKSMI